MPTIKPKRATASEILQHFGGIGRSVSSKEHSCSDLQNFRILSDGSLEKRCGFKTKFAFSETLRGFWDGFIGGKPLTCAVAGSELLIRENGSFVSKRTLETASGTVQFVVYREHLYLLDGNAIYVYSPYREVFLPAVGYVPLVGFQWDPTSLGTLHEPINLFSDKMRVHYKNTTGSTVYNLPFSAASIDFIRSNGVPITDYSFTPGSSSFSVGAVYSGLDIGFTRVITPDERAYIHSSTQAICDRLNDREIMLLFGGKSGTCLFGTVPVDDSMMSSSRSIYPTSDPLYCTFDLKISAGTPINPITSVYKQRDRFLAFHDNGALSLQIEENRFVSYPVLSGYGCTAKLPQTVIDDKFFIINRGGIFAVSSDASDPDLFSAVPIADSIPSLKTPSFSKNAIVCYNAEHEELWFCDKVNFDRVWVYQIRQKKWYTFSGFIPSFFLSYQGMIGFASGSGLYLFDETKSLDNGQPISATLTTGYLFVDSPETIKRVSDVTLLAQCGTNEIELQLNTENEHRLISLSSAVVHTMPILFERHVEAGRFRLLQITLTDTGEYRTHIYRLAVFANS